jgi:Flp pilus assembly protein TadB
LSSAILYVAIVAIWAGVLIPRWLRRDSAASQRASEELTTVEAEPSASAEVAAPPPRRRDDTAGSVARPARPQERVAPRAPAPAPAPAPAEVPGGRPRHQEHTKVLASRRRLLYMLLVLALGSGALAVTKMAAWWVVVPPTIMLLGYMGMLREAAKADAERRELARTRGTAAAAVGAARRDAPPAPAAPSAPPAPVPEAEVIAISASLTSVGQEFYDQYADAKLRAVGDLAPRLTG